MPNVIQYPQYVARIIGDLDTADLVPIDPSTNQGAANQASEAAMADLLATDFIDFYILAERPESTNAARYSNVPFGTRGVAIKPHEHDVVTTAVPVWIDHDPGHVQYLVEAPEFGLPAGLSSVAPALMFRRLFGTDSRRIDLGDEFGTVAFTPTGIEVGWRPGQYSGAGTPWYRFGYDDPGISNYVSVARYDDTFGAWLWFTDPETGEPEADWWKVSHVVAAGGAAPAARLDDPLQPPPRRPTTLLPATPETGV
jgi:hypothetical protein